MKASTADSLSGAVVIVGVSQGLVPFVARALSWTPFWSLPNHLDEPGWWMVSLVVLALTAVALTVLAQGKKRTG